MPWTNAEITERRKAEMPDATAEERTVGSLASRVAGMYARRDCRRPLRDGDLRDAPGDAT